MLKGTECSPDLGAGQMDRYGEADGVSLVLEASQPGFNILGQIPSPLLSSPRLMWLFLKQFIFFYFLQDTRFSFLFPEKNPIHSLPIVSLPEK